MPPQTPPREAARRRQHKAGRFNPSLLGRILQTTWEVRSQSSSLKYLEQEKTPWSSSVFLSGSFSGQELGNLTVCWVKRSRFGVESGFFGLDGKNQMLSLGNASFPHYGVLSWDE